ncbi:MAG TPA: oligosaccharide flippase family protein [Patescibacteria group bacterium]|nr:oligosaccharide flippase family protein [Patescibacteria group bacterium]
MGYTKQIIKGFSWAAVLNAIAMGISLIKIILLSHFVFGPVEFGVFGVGVLVLGILELITETGINIFLVQESEPIKTYLDTAWAVSIMRGITIALLLALFSYPIAAFFKITNNWVFILAFSLVPILRGFINPAIASLQKDLKFRQDATYRFIVSAIEDISIILLAFITRSIFAFIFGMLFGVLIEVIITFIFVEEKPKLNFNNLHFKKIVAQGKWVTLAQIFDYLFEHTDDVVVGRLLNVFSLGIYQNSYILSSLPENAIAQQLGKITFPIYVQMREDKQSLSFHDKKRIKRAFWRSFWSVFVMITPFALIMFFFSDPLVRILLGEKWLAAIPVLRILALFGTTRALTNLFYPVFLALKKQQFITNITLISWIFLGIFIFPLTKMYGISGAAISALVGSIAGLPVAYFYFKKLL